MSQSKNMVCDIIDVMDKSCTERGGGENTHVSPLVAKKRSSGSINIESWLL